MKNKIKILAIIVIVLGSAFVSGTLKAQFALTNGLNPCDVLIGYEIGDPSSSCNVCSSGTLLIPGGQTVLLQDCFNTGFDRICIWIVEIDGVPVSNSCHNDCKAMNGCCFQNCTGDVIPATANCGASSAYTINVMPGISWDIQ